jgi:hypothetical protein
MNRSENDIIPGRRGICQRQVAAYLGTDRLRGHVIPAALLFSLDLHWGPNLNPAYATIHGPFSLIGADPCQWRWIYAGEPTAYGGRWHPHTRAGSA